eukprot:CAMPEP_0118849990 /NCGR_PEP_ID=MMETSP1163-20130328/59_1 /TAXON_ID=124430 /ORGANISM="Phaeomonas parva, Strain CCMP2877" /LENGTH=275 /DNA_ID=CAMNT_0006782185 /DNA_START=123 /DNA_END=950 /DNA_ORIENTATION=+
MALKALALAMAAASASAMVASTPINIAMPARVVPKTLPVVYVYDHCPYCVRVRFALGMKNIKHDVRFLMNDDVETPTNLIGKKVAPIWEVEGEAMGESMDIIKKVDADEAYGETGYFKEASGRKDIGAWQKKYATQFRLLQRPRYVHPQSVLPEFQQREAREYFMRGHFVPLDGHDKKSFKELPMEKIQAYYEQAISMSPELIEEVSAGLLELEPLIHCEEYCTEGGLSYDDVDLWARLRSISLIKGLKVPPKVDAYMRKLSEASDVPLYWNTAL